jgi:hypothetical protein
VNEFSVCCKSLISSLASLVESLQENNITTSSNASVVLKNTLAMMSGLSKRISSKWDIAEMTEDTFTMNAFDVIASPSLTNIPSTNYHCADHQLKESKDRKKELAEKGRYRRHHVILQQHR